MKPPKKRKKNPHTRGVMQTQVPSTYPVFSALTCKGGADGRVASHFPCCWLKFTSHLCSPESEAPLPTVYPPPLPVPVLACNVGAPTPPTLEK